MKQSFLILFLLISMGTSAQTFQATVISSSGDHFAASNGLLTWTLGEPMGELFSSPKGYLTQGFHQPNFIRVTGVEESPERPAIVYPNPFTSRLMLALGEGDFLVTLSDLQGRILISTELTFTEGQTHEIDVAPMAPALYILQFLNKATLSTHQVKLQKL